MTSITVTEEQARIIKGSPKAIEVRSPTGESLGVLSSHHAEQQQLDATEEDIRIALERRATGGPSYTTAEVLAHLRTLENSE